MIVFRPPGDKSISHRALMLAPLAGEPSELRGLADGADVRSTLEAMRALGASWEEVEGPAGGGVRLESPAGLRAAEGPIDCGNSGTTARLLAGLLVGSGVGGTLDGDDSLRRRPMRRIAYPLQAMGARIEYLDVPDRLPLRIAPRATGTLRRIRHRGRVASAQVKSAILLAGLTGRVPVEVHEPARSRDHTERMLAAMGAPVVFDPDRVGEGSVSLDPTGWAGALGGLDLEVPGDASAAAFLIGAALLSRRSVRVDGVGANPGRIGFVEVLQEMGADIRRETAGSRAGEPVETWTVRPSDRLRAFEIGGDRIPGVIDEIPLLAVLAARADGTSVIRGAAELRVKESDRITGLAGNLRAAGVEVEEHADGLSISGTQAPLSGRIAPSGDHRLAMAFGVLGGSNATLEIADRECAAVSFPGFWSELERIVAPETDASRAPAGGGRRLHRVIAIDGPAASGKSTAARGVAERLGYVHVNSGLFYRAITWWALREGLGEEDPELAARVRGLDIRLVPEGSGLGVSIGGERPGGELQGAEVAARVSAISAVRAVRDAVLDRLRAAAGGHDLVCDGRDIGTTVFPEADLKVYLVADPRERARRRLLESDASLGPDGLAAEIDRLEARDRTDSERELSPLRRAPDAVEIDTTHTRPEDVVRQIVSLADERGFGPPRIG